MRAQTQTVDSAKQFLLSKVLEQAQADGVSFSELEKRMLLFSEPSASDADMEASQRFDAECNDEEYEVKAAKLFRRVYSHDKKTEDGRNSWKEALDALSGEDFYGLVMIDQAGIPRTRSYRAVLSVFNPEDVLFATFEIVVLAAGFIFAFDPFHWGLIHSDVVKLALMLVSIGIVWFVGKLWGQRMVSRGLKSQR